MDAIALLLGYCMMVVGGLILLAMLIYALTDYFGRRAWRHVLRLCDMRTIQHHVRELHRAGKLRVPGRN